MRKERRIELRRKIDQELHELERWYYRGIYAFNDLIDELSWLKSSLTMGTLRKPEGRRMTDTLGTDLAKLLTDLKV